MTNAIEVAKWLRSIGALEKNIHIFLGVADEADPRILPLRQDDFDVRLAADSKSIDTFWRSELTRDVPADSRLLSFWSGHGFTSKRRNRIFFCNDYTSTALHNRIFNGTEFLNTLLTRDFACFPEQIVLADVCGVYDDIAVPDTVSELELVERKQLAFFATPEGKYADGNDGVGVFTSAVLKVLEAQKSWPNQEAFTRALESAFKKSEVAPFRVSGFSGSREMRETVVGRSSKSDESGLVQTLFGFLRQLDVVEEVFRPHYLRTVNDLGNPELARAQGLVGMLKELSSLLDERLPNELTRGLLQFLLRLSSEKQLTEPITAWLENNAAGQKNTIDVLRAKLKVETRRKMLVIVLEVDASEEIAAFKAYLCNCDFSLVPGWKFERRVVAGWDAFERQMQILLAEFISEGSLTNLEVHFAVDPPLFDRPFHRIAVAPGRHAIGEDIVVVVRHRQRMLSGDLALKRAWCAYAERLRAEKTKKLKWLKLSLNEKLPDDEGLFLATFVLPEPVSEKPSGRLEKDIIRRLLKLGAPYVYLPHSAPVGDDWKAVEMKLRKIVSKNATLGSFPFALLQERVRGSSIGASGSIIWDDPLTVPVGVTEGVRFG